MKEAKKPTLRFPTPFNEISWEKGFREKSLFSLATSCFAKETSSSNLFFKSFLAAPPSEKTSFSKIPIIYPLFERINKFGEDNGVTIEHYIISSGITEIIEGTEIAKYFKAVYGCSFLYDDKGEAIWPAIAINFTQKTQYIFRVSKGVLSVTDDKNLNKATSKKERRIPYENMIYIGDGITDIPCMTLIREKGGKALAIYPSGGKTKAAEQLVKEQRIDFVTVANYSEDSTLTKTIKLYIESMAVMANLKEKEEKQLAMYLKASEEER